MAKVGRVFLGDVVVESPEERKKRYNTEPAPSHKTKMNKHTRQHKDCGETQKVGISILRVRP